MALVKVRRFVSLGLVILAVTSTHGKKSNGNEVRHLIGEPDFRDVSLQWQYDPAAAASDVDVTSTHNTAPPTFQIRYCELQAWGPHRCRTKVIDDAVDSNHVLGLPARPSDSDGHTWSARVSGLRMATSYSFEVRPLRHRGPPTSRAERLLEPIRTIVVPTKGFSARATQCLPHMSEVEVTTGPYFAGRIAVEGGAAPACSVDGDPSSPRDTYSLRIDHSRCGGEVNETTQAAYVLVQESLAILTHSTRRFLVLCSYKPETLTVRAGINLPSSITGPGTRLYRPRGVGQGQAQPQEEEDDSVNEVSPARLRADLVDHAEDGTGQAIFLVILTVAGVAGSALLVWRFIPAGARAAAAALSISSRGSVASSFDDKSDTGSVYSISLSECDHSEQARHTHDDDNTSEA